LGRVVLRRGAALWIEGRTQLEVSRHGLWDFNLVTGKGYLTPGFRRFLGYAEYESGPTRRGGFELIHPDDREAAERLLREHLDGGIDEYEARVRLRKKNGDYVYVLSRGKVIARDATSRALRMMGVHLDLTAAAARADAW
jgi:PAS domain S-box-containing protein